MKTRHCRDLQVWQKSMILAGEAYALTARFPRTEVFGLTSQIRRAAVSVPSNIAEGHGRLSDRGFEVFLGHARGSLFELETQAELAAKLGFAEHDECEAIIEHINEVARMLNGLLATLRACQKKDS